MGEQPRERDLTGRGAVTVAAPSTRAAGRAMSLRARERRPREERELLVARTRLQDVLGARGRRRCSGSGPRRSGRSAARSLELARAPTLDRPMWRIFPSVLQLGERADGVLDRHLRVDGVQLVEVDPLEPEPPQASPRSSAAGAPAGSWPPSGSGPGARARPWSRSRGRRGTGAAPRRSGARTPRDRTSRRCRSGSRRSATTRRSRSRQPARVGGLAPDPGAGDAHRAEAEAVDLEVVADCQRRGRHHGLLGLY